MSNRRKLKLASMVFTLKGTGVSPYLARKLKWQQKREEKGLKGQSDTVSLLLYRLQAFRGSFRYAASKCWNNLPPPVKNALEYHRHELELRISRFNGECDLAIDAIKNLRIHARSFLETLPGDRTELKTRFLWCTRQLDEYMYLVTEFNISVSKFAEENDWPKTSDASKDPVLPPMKNGQSETNISRPQLIAPKNPILSPMKNGQSETDISGPQLIAPKNPLLSPVKNGQSETDISGPQLIAPKNSMLSPMKNGQSETDISRPQLNICAQKLQVSQTPAKPLPQTQIKHISTENPRQTKALPVHKTEAENWRDRSQIIQTRTKQWQEPQNLQANQTGRASRRKGPHTSRPVKPKEDLIQFSSLSCSAESVTDQTVAQKEVTEKNDDKESESVGMALPPQAKLDAGSVSACIASVDGTNLWLVTDMTALSKLTNEMTEYYNKYETSTEDVPEFSGCAYFDDETKSYFRAIFMKAEGVAEAFLLDTGEYRPLSGPLRPLASRFYTVPPLAHCCHLANVDLLDDKVLREKQATFLSKHLWEEYRIGIHSDADDNNSSQSQGVYIYLDNGTTLNELLARELALISKPQPTEAPDICNDQAEEQLSIRQSQSSDQDNIHLDDLDSGPEYENPLEAVTGYSNRDEMDICKHYDGGPDRTCFKGSRCKKRHVLQHPDGWTLDRVSVVASCRPASLPVPGTSCKVKVTHVRDVGCFFVQFETKDEPITLAMLVEDMTRNAANAKPLKILPALGELVSAQFTDGRWYRARVTSCDDELGTVEVIFVDYGNESSVKLTDLCPLEPRWLALPIAAVRCRLAGVTIITDKSVTDVFTGMVLDLVLQARVIARSYDELTLELFDLEGFKVSDQLAVMADVPLQPYEVEDDSKRISLLLPA